MTRRLRGYVVCATPRSGSNYLCELLTSTGVLGNPREYFNAVGRRKYDDPQYPDDPQDQLQQVLTTGATPNRVYGVKVHPFQLTALPATCDPLARLPRVRAVRLIREDRLGQALSWSRAQLSGQHRAGDLLEGAVSYDMEHILESMRFLEREDAEWQRRLAVSGLDVLTVSYEDVVAAPQAQVDRIARLMGVGAARVDAARVSVTVQRDAVTEEWRRRYLTESGDADPSAVFDL